MMDTPSIAAGRKPSSGVPFRLGVFGDERLARLVGTGSERAFGAIYERYHQPLYRYCRSIVRDDCDAQDALQSTMASALVALRRGQRDAPLRPWLFRIAHNEAISLIRRRRSDGELTDQLEHSVPSAEDRVSERSRLALLVADLRELPDRQRGALVMRELSGLSHEEIALALGVSVGAAKQTIFEARRSLSEFAEGRAMSCEEVSRTISDADGRALRSRRVRAHLRDCSACASFAAAIPARRAELRAIAPPLPALTAAGLLARALGGGSSYGGGGAGGVVAGVAGKTASAAVAAKTLAGVAVVATATVGAATALRHTEHPPRHAPQTAPVTHSSAAARATHFRVGPSHVRASARHAPPHVARAGTRPRARLSSVAHGATRARSVTAAGATRNSAGPHGLTSAHAPGASTRGAVHRPIGATGVHHTDSQVSPTGTGRSSTAGAGAPASSAPPAVPSPREPQTPGPTQGQPPSQVR